MPDLVVSDDRSSWTIETCRAEYALALVIRFPKDENSSESPEIRLYDIGGRPIALARECDPDNGQWASEKVKRYHPWELGDQDHQYQLIWYRLDHPGSPEMPPPCLNVKEYPAEPEQGGWVYSKMRRSRRQSASGATSRAALMAASRVTSPTGAEGRRAGGGEMSKGRELAFRVPPPLLPRTARGATPAPPPQSLASEPRGSETGRRRRSVYDVVTSLALGVARFASPRPKTDQAERGRVEGEAAGRQPEKGRGRQKKGQALKGQNVARGAQ